MNLIPTEVYQEAELIQAVRLLSGLTIAELAELFEKVAQNGSMELTGPIPMPDMSRYEDKDELDITTDSPFEDSRVGRVATLIQDIKPSKPF